jgi:hypothetical protein
LKVNISTSILQTSYEKTRRDIQMNVFLLPFPCVVRRWHGHLIQGFRRPALDFDPDFELILLPLAVAATGGTRTLSLNDTFKLAFLAFPRFCMLTWSASQYLPTSQKHAHKSYEVCSLEKEARGEGDTWRRRQRTGDGEDEDEEDIGKGDGADASLVMKEGHEVNSGDNRVLGLGAGASSRRSSIPVSKGGNDWADVIESMVEAE